MCRQINHILCNIEGLIRPHHFILVIDGYRKYSGNFLVNMLGKWKESEYSEQSVPVGGLAYYVTAPSQGND
ncbi:unnamed protein product [Lactuca virosa]|uniref:Piwi domain-containing protein n=1 Tax=Lactuca virosa TaxID=75947 RepID=A0AAU9PAY0_9ASTR|nr:unnamed protein product [Lactuca virosa]